MKRRMDKIEQKWSQKGLTVTNRAGDLLEQLVNEKMDGGKSWL